MLCSPVRRDRSGSERLGGHDQSERDAECDEVEWIGDKSGDCDPRSGGPI